MAMSLNTMISMAASVIPPSSTGAATMGMAMSLSDIMSMAASAMPSSSTAAVTMAMGTGSMSSMANSSMDMDMGPGSCKISMLWNWYTIDACFISSTWHITSTGMFGGSCFGVICLVCALEFLRRLTRDYDRYLMTRFMAPNTGHAPTSSYHQKISHTERIPGPAESITSKDLLEDVEGTVISSHCLDEHPHEFLSDPRRRMGCKPTLFQQVIRAALHMLQFGVAYFVMLLAMYFNGYIIICILIGAFIGSFWFSWDLDLSGQREEVSGCCG